jgi:hypothetical protein
MNYIFKELRGLVIPYAIISFFLAFTPWVTGPFLLNWFGIYAMSFAWFLLFVFVRAIWLSYKKRNNT